MIRLKFKCEHITRFARSAEVVLTPVSDGSEENRALARSFPGGQLKFRCADLDSLAELEPGEEYTLELARVSDTIPAPPPEAG